MDSYLLIFSLIVLVMSSVVHEYMHGWAANELGDNTAKMLGRLTLNPLAHLDPFGSFLLPIILYLATSGAFVFGFAKPVPYNPLNLKEPRFDSAKVAAAGPFANLAIAVMCGLLMRFLPSENETFLILLSLIVQINLILMIFNLLPIPPLDGSKILLPFLPEKWQAPYLSLERYGLFIALIFASFAFPFLMVIVEPLFRLLVGI